MEVTSQEYLVILKGHARLLPSKGHRRMGGGVTEGPEVATEETGQQRGGQWGSLKGLLRGEVTKGGKGKPWRPPVGSLVALLKSQGCAHFEKRIPD